MNETVLSREMFRNDLITAILSVPLVYIPHYHYDYVDEVLSEIFPQKQSEDASLANRTVTGLYSDSIYEFDINRGPINFNTKLMEKSASASSRGLINLLSSLLVHSI